MKKTEDTITPEDLGFPSKIGDFNIDPVSWNSFPAAAPQNTWFLAYTYWTSNYKYHYSNRNGKLNKFRVVFTTSISPKSWHKRGCQDQDLLQHQYGHYLINCIMGLDFRYKANVYGRTCSTEPQFKTFCENLFNEKRKQYSEKQKQYDKDSYHYLDREGQQKWQKWMKKQILDYAAKQKQFESQSKQIQLKQQAMMITVKPQAEAKTNKNVNQPQKKQFSIRKVQKNQATKITRNSSVPRPNNNKPLNTVKYIADLYKKQEIY